MNRFALSCLLSLALMPVAAEVRADESKPWAQVVLGAPKLSDPRQMQLVMIAVDAKRDFSPETLYALTPGTHELAVAPTIPGNLGELRAIAFTLEMAPCMSYELVADVEPGTSADNRHWKPVVKAARPIKRCMKKFDLAAPAAGGPDRP